MSNKPLVCRKSKRVAKRQEDEIYWLMHNFPQGIDYSDLCENASVKAHTSPPSSKTRDLLTSVNEKLSDESTAKVALKMPRVLRSGKSIAAQTLYPSSDGETSSCPDKGSTDQKGEIHGEGGDTEEDKKHVSEESKANASLSDTAKEPASNNKNESSADKNLSTETPEASSSKKSEGPTIKRIIITRSTRSRSDVGCLEMTEPPPKIIKRKSAPVTCNIRKASSETETSKDNDLTPEEKAQIERVELLKQPKFQSGPGKLCTRSGAAYAFSWKSAKSVGSKRQTSLGQVDADDVGTDPDQIVTRSGRKKQDGTSDKQSTTSAPLAPNIENITIKVEKEDAVVEESKPTFKKIKVGPPNLDYPAFMFAGSNGNMALSAPRPKSLNLPRKGKRKRLSLLPTQKNEEDDFTATWLEALNRSQTPSPFKNSPSCSRSESPVSPVSSHSSEQVPVVPKRRGRTASLNCRAVLSALMKPEPARKASRKSPPKIIPSPKTKQIKTENEPDNFFKIKVTPSYSQKIEYVNNGFSSRIHNSPNSLRAHEAKILANSKKIKVTTNGWNWCGTYVWCCSFYRDTNIKTTRLYFSAMGRDGVELRVGDSVALQASDKEKKPFVGKIIAMWHDNLGEMMVTLCWFYRPSDLENIKTPYSTHELYLSKHTDDNSVATIQDKVYVLSFPEYCRYYAHQAQTGHKSLQYDIVPNVIKWRDQVMPSTIVQDDSIYFCRGVYDFRLKRTLKQQLYYTKYL